MNSRIRRDEAGATLLFVIGFMLLIGFMTTGLVTQIASSSHTRLSLDTARNREYAADAAIEADIGQVRSNMTGGQALSPCPGALRLNPGLNNVPVQVDCSYPATGYPGITLSGFVQRNVVFKACVLQPVGTPCPPAAVLIEARRQLRLRYLESRNLDHGQQDLHSVLEREVVKTHRAQCSRENEDGFTLIEMIIALVVSGMLLAALTSVFLTGTTSVRATTQRTHESDDAQVISSFLVRDAQAAGGIDPFTGLNDSTLGVFTDNPTACSITGTALRFRWIERATGTTIDTVYWTSGTTLSRTLCKTLGGSTTTSVTKLATTIASASTSCTTSGTADACNDGVNNKPRMPDSVSLTLTSTNSGQADGTPYTYTLTANLRPARIAAGDIPGPDNSSPAALLTLGASCPPAGINLSNNAVLKVYGDVVMNQGAVCVTQSNGSDLHYQSLTNSAGILNPLATLPPPSAAGLPARRMPGRDRPTRRLCSRDLAG